MGKEKVPTPTLKTILKSVLDLHVQIRIGRNMMNFVIKSLISLVEFNFYCRINFSGEAVLCCYEKLNDGK